MFLKTHRGYSLVPQNLQTPVTMNYDNLGLRVYCSVISYGHGMNMKFYCFFFFPSSTNMCSSNLKYVDNIQGVVTYLISWNLQHFMLSLLIPSWQKVI